MPEEKKGLFSKLVGSKEEKDKENPKGFFTKIRQRLAKTKETLISQTLSLFRLRGKIDEELFEQIEECLISADVGVETSLHLVECLRERAARDKPDEEQAYGWLRSTLQEMIRKEIGDEISPLVLEDSLNVVLIVGVNGVGKTTTIGKLAHRLKQEGREVIIAAADTFRAAAQDQLKVWSKRSGCPIVEGAQGADPASVVYTAVQKARSVGADVVLVDTAGRLHNKSNLMKELEKISRVIGREVEGAPQETLLVLDASTGQNGLSQAKVFKEMVSLTGIILTKLDGTAKGGVTIAVKKQLGIPVKFVGLGEGLEDLEPFDPTSFVDALFSDGESLGSRTRPD